jgi:oligopeptide transport system permease protein
MSVSRNSSDLHQGVAARPLEEYAHLLEEAKRIKGVSLWQDAWKRLKRNRMAMASLVFLVVLVVLAVLTPLLPLQSPIDQDLKNRDFRPPSWNAIYLGGREELKFQDNSLTAELAEFDAQMDAREMALAAGTPEERTELEQEYQRSFAADHPFGKLWNQPNILTRGLVRLRLAIFGDWSVPSVFGTDQLGRDVLSRVFWGARVSLAVGIVATIVSLLIGVTYGAVSGYLGGWVDAIMMRFVDVLYSIPFIFVVIYLITIISEDTIKARLDAVGIDQIMVFYIVIGAIYWLTMARVVRGQVISLKNEQFIEAARTTGATRGRIVFVHLIPNVLGIVIVYLTLTIPAVMLFEAFLSFLGLGVQPPDVSWGLLMNEGIKVITPLKTYWWLVVYPGVALALTLFALNFLGDGLRDALDPRMKNR